MDRDAVYSEIGWRLLRFVVACYVINYVDRVSIGYAKPQFLNEQHLNEAVAYLSFPLAVGNLWTTSMLVGIAAAGGCAVFMVFWTVPPVFLEARGAAMGLR